MTSRSGVWPEVKAQPPAILVTFGVKINKIGPVGRGMGSPAWMRQ